MFATDIISLFNERILNMYRRIGWNKLAAEFVTFIM